jgi:hypothetical protein
MNSKNPLTTYLIAVKAKRDRIERKIILFLCCLFILSLNSCSQLTSIVDTTVTPLSRATPNSSATPLPTATLVPITTPLPTATLVSSATPLPTAALISTLHSYPTRISVFDYPDQVTDGLLLLSVDKITDKCYKSGEPMQLKFVFENLTDEPLKIPSGFSIAINRRGDKGNIAPLITSTEGVDLFLFADVEIPYFKLMTSNDYITLLGDDDFEIILEYLFPKNVYRQEHKTYKPMPSSPGRYYLRFVYSENERDIDTWYGAIGSNRIEICLID